MVDAGDVRPGTARVRSRTCRAPSGGRGTGRSDGRDCPSCSRWSIGIHVRRGRLPDAGRALAHLDLDVDTVPPSLHVIRDLCSSTWLFPIGPIVLVVAVRERGSHHYERHDYTN